MWDEKGDVGFYFYNKFTDEIVVDLSRTFFVRNGVANPYFKMRQYSLQSSIAAGVGKSEFYGAKLDEEVNIETKTRTESYEEARFIVVPPKTKVRISEYQVVTDLFKNCSLPKSGKTSMTINFSRNESPFVFYNRVAYSTRNKDSVVFENKFYVEAISNIPEPDMIDKIDTNKCGKKYLVPIRVIRNYGADHYYIPYTVE